MSTDFRQLDLGPISVLILLTPFKDNVRLGPQIDHSLTSNTAEHFSWNRDRPRSTFNDRVTIEDNQRRIVFGEALERCEQQRLII